MAGPLQLPLPSPCPPLPAPKDECPWPAAAAEAEAVAGKAGPQVWNVFLWLLNIVSFFDVNRSGEKDI